MLVSDWWLARLRFLTCEIQNPYKTNGSETVPLRNRHNVYFGHFWTNYIWCPSIRLAIEICAQHKLVWKHIASRGWKCILVKLYVSETYYIEVENIRGIAKSSHLTLVKNPDESSSVANTEKCLAFDMFILHLIHIIFKTNIRLKLTHIVWVWRKGESNQLEMPGGWAGCMFEWLLFPKTQNGRKVCCMNNIQHSSVALAIKTLWHIHLVQCGKQLYIVYTYFGCRMAKRCLV